MTAVQEGDGVTHPGFPGQVMLVESLYEDVQSHPMLGFVFVPYARCSWHEPGVFAEALDYVSETRYRTPPSIRRSDNFRVAELTRVKEGEPC